MTRMTLEYFKKYLDVFSHPSPPPTEEVEGEEDGA